MQPKPEPKHTHPRRAPRPGVAGCKRSAHTSTRQEWRDAAETRAKTHTPTARTQARSGGVQAKRPHLHTPGVTGCSRNPSRNTHTHGAHPSQEWRGASGAPTPAHASSGGVQPKPEPKHTHPRRAPRPGVAGCKRSAHTSTRQEWRDAAETRAKTHTPTARTQARSGGVQAKRPHLHTPGVTGCSRNPSPNTHTHSAHPSQEWRSASGAPTPAHARSGGMQLKPEPEHTHPRRALQPGVAGCKRSGHTSTHQVWRGAAKTRAQTHTPTARTPARSGGVQAERPHQHTHSPTPQPGVAGLSRNRSPNTQTPTAHPSQEWRGTRGACTQTREPRHPSQERQGAAETRAQAHTPTPSTPAPSGGVKGEQAHKHAHPNTAARSGGAQPKTRAQTHTPTPRTPARSGGVQAERAHEHTHSPTPQPEVAGRSRNPSTNTHTHTAHPSQEWQGASGARTRAHTQPNSRARSGLA